jgi:mitofusin
VTAPVYPGVLGAWDYAAEVRKALLASLDMAVRGVEDDARLVTADTVTRITDIGEKHLPADVEKCKRVFNPQAMFYNHARKTRRASGLQSVGLGLAGNSALSDVVVSDIFDLQHFFFLTESVPSAVSDKMSPLRDLIPLSKEVSSIGAASLAVGAFSVVGGKALALRTLVETAIHLSDLAANPVVRKWAGPAIGILAAGAVAYVIYELPRSIPRNVGRNLRSQLLITSGATEADDESPFFEAEAQRIGREVRKVMRLAAWDLRERFRTAMEARNEIVRQSEETAKQAARALEWFAEIEERVDTIRDQLGLKL